MSALVEQIVFEDVWQGLYGESWKGLISDDAFAHPAKFSRALIRRIYDHVIEEGWATRGSSVIDPFGGVALGAHDAMRHGLNWYGCELESRFVLLGAQNIALWNERFSRMPNWGTARLLQGDSRKLAEALSTTACCVSSPPYAGKGNEGKTADRDRRRLERLRPDLVGRFDTCFRGGDYDYGENTKGQLGAMKEGDLSLAVSSPPYVGSLGNAKNYADPEKAKAESDRDFLRHASPTYTDLRYGTTEGQLGAMPEGQLCVSSPPFESSTQVNNTPGDITEGRARWEGGTDSAARVKQDYADYGTDNLGNQRGETFWSASRLILEQLHQVTVPSGHAVFVVKAFVRDKKIVDFPGQWAQLCEAVGFRLLHHHRASLVEHSGTQGGFDEDKEIRVERKSFFRRLAEAKGSPRIDHESVLCFERA